jgi:hypothetical protein
VADRIRVPGHEAAPTTRVRRAAHRALTVTGMWWLLLGRIQGAVCGCPRCRGESGG